MLTSPPILMLLDCNKPVQLHTNASEVDIGAVLTRTDEGSEHVIVCAGHSWSMMFVHRSATERELMAILWAIDKPRYYLQGRKFTLITDYSARTWLSKGRMLSSKLPR